MTTIVTILTDGYADWETALLNAAARQYLKVETLFATPGGAQVISSGGLRVTPDMAVEDIDPAAIDAVVVNGGTIWSTPGAPDITSTLRAVNEAGKVVAGICDGTLTLARAGLLDTVKHTSNHPGNLPPTGYKGEALYQDQPQAVVDGKIVTAPGSAPTTFMGGVLETLGLRTPDVAHYIGLYGAEHKTSA